MAYRCRSSRPGGRSVSRFFCVAAALLALGALWPAGPAAWGQQAQPKAQAKYVFFFIGDGMGLAQRTAAELYLGAMESSLPKAGQWRLAMNRMPAQGLSTTFGAETTITESSAAGTALACGQKTVKGCLGLGADRKTRLPSLAERAHRKGLKVGIVSTASIDHATPAAFYAHQVRRSSYHAIGLELAASPFEFFGGGGFLQPKGKDSKGKDVIAAARAGGFALFRTAEEIRGIPAGCPKALAIHPVLDRDASMMYEIDRKEGEPSLAEITRKAIEVLDGPAGFFLMVEGGKIDWACHANDAASAVRDVIALDEAVQEAMKFAQAHREQTLVVVTADHETGGMSIGYSATGYQTHLERLALQKMSQTALARKVSDYRKKNTIKTAKFEDVLPLIAEATGMAPARALPPPVPAEDEDDDKDGKNDKKEKSDLDKVLEEEARDAALYRVDAALTPAEMDLLKAAFDASMRKLLPRPKVLTVDVTYGGKEPLALEATRILNRKAGIAWTTFTHTGSPVPVSAAGAGQEAFMGLMDNTDVSRRIAGAMGLEVEK